MEEEITLRIVLEKPTAGVDFGIQQGRGSEYQTIQKQRSNGKDLHFEFDVRVRPNGKAVAPNFLGSFVHGPSGGRFIYIDIGTYAGQTETPWSRRLKIPLGGISWDTIDRVAAERVSIEPQVGKGARRFSAAPPRSLISFHKEYSIHLKSRVRLAGARLKSALPPSQLAGG